MTSPPRLLHSCLDFSSQLELSRAGFCLGKGEQIRRGESGEATLHELYGFGNYTTWCERNCASVRSRKRVYEEGILAKGWESLEAYYEAMGSEPDIAVDTPLERIAYVCRQCRE